MNRDRLRERERERERERGMERRLPLHGTCSTDFIGHPEVMTKATALKANEEVCEYVCIHNTHCICLPFLGSRISELGLNYPVGILATCPSPLGTSHEQMKPCE